MDARAQLFNDIKGVIASRVEEIKHVGLWNQEMAVLENDAPYELPVLLIEFGNIEWGTYTKGEDGNRFAVGEGSLKYHLLCGWHSETDDLLPFILSEKVIHALATIPNSAIYSVFYPLMTFTNHDHADIVESGEAFKVKYYRSISSTWK